MLSKLASGHLLSGALAATALGGGAYAALNGIPDRSGVFHACVDRASGAVRLVSTPSSCRKPRVVKRGGRRVRVAGEFAVSWNQQGPAGARGTKGFTGFRGAAGLTGGQGPKGETGAPGPQGPGAASLLFSAAKAEGQTAQLAQLGSFTIKAQCAPGPEAKLEVSDASSPFSVNFFGQNAADDSAVAPFQHTLSGPAGSTQTVPSPPAPASGHFVRSSGQALVTTAPTTVVAVTFNAIADARGGAEHPECQIVGQAVPSS